MFKVKIRFWTAHHNMFLYALFYLCKRRKLRFNIDYSDAVPYNCVILECRGKSYFFDYADTPEILSEPSNYISYFKRSFLKNKNYDQSIKPLGLQVNYSYKPLSFLSYLKKKHLLDQRNRIELLRALDYFEYSNLSHHSMDIRSLPSDLNLFNKNIIFFTRLWNPNNHISEEEKSRRRTQNEFRIRTCRILDKSFKNVHVGIYPDAYSKSQCPDLILGQKQISKRNYLMLLRHSAIGIADDGLKDTPGWKLGEYCLFGKAVITTPITVELSDFIENENYLKLSNRSAVDEIPEKVEFLLKGDRYKELAQNNLEWALNNLHPDNYLINLIPDLK